MKAYKGFTKIDNGKLICRNMEYKPGKTYKHEGQIKLCKSGFHACHELYQVWNYYPNNGENVFYEVECGGIIIESDDDSSKFVCSKITLIRPVDIDNVALFDVIGEFFEGFARVSLNDKYNFINTDGKLLSNRWFDDAGDFSGVFTTVKLDEKWNFINTKGKFLSEQWFDYVWCFSEGFASVRLGRKWNYINTEGKLMSELWFDYAYDFSEGFARVVLDGKYNYINTEGKLLSEQWFNYADGFSEGFANVIFNGKWFRIDTEGKIILQV